MEMAISRNRLEETSRRLFQCLPVRVVASSLTCGLLGVHLVAYTLNRRIYSIPSTKPRGHCNRGRR